MRKANNTSAAIPTPKMRRSMYGRVLKTPNGTNLVGGSSTGTSAATMSAKANGSAKKRRKAKKEMTRDPAADAAKCGMKTCAHEGIVCYTTMTNKMQLEAVACAKWAVRKYGADKQKEIGEYMRKEFDEQHGEQWQCVVGNGFSVNVRYNEKMYIHMEMDENLDIILFQTD